MTPDEPAVGAATISPMEVFVSRTAMEYAMALDSTLPQIDFPLEWCRVTSCASPPISPPIDRLGEWIGAVADSRITARE